MNTDPKHCWKAWEIYQEAREFYRKAREIYRKAREIYRKAREIFRKATQMCKDNCITSLLPVPPLDNNLRTLSNRAVLPHPEQHGTGSGRLIRVPADLRRSQDGDPLKSEPRVSVELSSLLVTVIQHVDDGGVSDMAQITLQVIKLLTEPLQDQTL